MDHIGGGIAYGADYNPEQWERGVWAEDLELMRRAGVNLVSVGVFSWSHLEPRPGLYHFEWMDEVLDGLAGANIKANLANATASPPPWFSHRYPETLPMRRDGSRLWPGARQAYCPSSPIFLEHGLALTAQVGKRYAGHPALAMWHVSNEIGGHNAQCFCDVSAAHFRRWLRDRYGDLDRLNSAWGTAVWSQRYSDWEEILPPRQAPSLRNPSHDLDFRRFSSDACLDVYRAERDVLRELTPSVPITTNFMVNKFKVDVDYWSWAPEVDVVANDHYRDGSDPLAHVERAFSGDVTRGLAGGAPWMLMEHSPSAVNWQPRNVAKRPGEMVRDSIQHVARGADAVMFFQWRAAVSGPEKFHAAMVPHAGTASKIWREVVELGTILRRLAVVAGTTLHADVALMFDWQSWWAFQTEGQPSIDVDYLDRVHAVYRALWEAGITVDVLPPSGDPAPYRLVVVPSLYLTAKETAAHLERFVAGGGSALVTYLSGVTDENLHVHRGGYPGVIREWLGIRVEEFFPLREGERVALDDGTHADTWCELLHLDGAEALAAYTDGPLPGVPAVTTHAHGEGRAWYVATRLGYDGLRRLVRQVLKATGVKPPIPMVTAPEGLEVTRRSGDGRSYLFLVNHGRDTAHLRVTGHDLVSGRNLTGFLSLQGGQVAVVREDA
jgi:beta-galactosidase